MQLTVYELGLLIVLFWACRSLSDALLLAARRKQARADTECRADKFTGQSKAVEQAVSRGIITPPEVNIALLKGSEPEIETSFSDKRIGEL